MELPELPQPVDFCRDQEDHVFDTFTADQMRAYGEQCALAERERCAKVCEAEEVDGSVSREDKAYNMAIEHCAEAIRKGE